MLEKICKMIPKAGDTARGFRFSNCENSEGISYWSGHEDCFGLEGTITRIEFNHKKTTGFLIIYFTQEDISLAYPMQEFLADNKQWLRERRLVELGIE